MTKARSLVVAIVSAVALVLAYAFWSRSPGGRPSAEPAAQVLVEGTTTPPLPFAVLRPQPPSTASTLAGWQELVVGTRPAADFEKAGVKSWLQLVDEALIERVDVFRLLTPGAKVFLWRDGAGELAAVKIVSDRAEAFSAFLYRGEAAPAGWYDIDGQSLKSGLRARPMAASNITSAFGVRHHPLGKHSKRMHRGTDYGAARGTPVFAVADGTVEKRAFDQSRGNYLVIGHDSGEYRSHYFHLSKSVVNRGEAVEMGQAIGEVGSTGRSTGPHLHFEFEGPGGYSIDGAAFRPAPRASLGPLAKAEMRETIETLRKAE